MEHLPPWLRNLPLPPRPASGTTPDWLHDVVPSVSPTKTTPEPVDNTPDWLRELQSEIGAAPTGDTSLPGVSPHRDDSDTPDWLRDVETSEPTAPTRPAPFGATNWLHGLSSSSDSADVPEPEPKPEPPSTTTTSRNKIKMPVGATDWLRSIGQESDPADVKPPQPSLSEMIDVKSGVPDWLRDVSSAEIESISSSEPVADEPPSQKVFDPLSSSWLTDEPAGTQDDRTVLANWADDASAQAETIAADGVPDWLRDVTPVSFDAPVDQGRLRDPGSVPDWLSGSDSPDSSTTDSGVPDWLRDVSGGDTSPGDTAPSWLNGPAATPEPSTDAGDVPDWLREAEERSTSVPTPAPVEDDIPAWLRNAEESPAPAAPAPVEDDIPAWLRNAEESPAPAPPPVEDDIPAWLRDAEESPAPAPPPVEDDIPAWLRDAEEHPTPVPAPAPVEDDIPAWLRDAEEHPTPVPAPAPVEDDIPAWLRDAEERPTPVPAPAPVEDDVPAWLRDVEEHPTPVPAPAPVEDDIPAWLRDAEERPAPPAPAPAPTAPTPASAPEPAPADVPDWLREAAGPPDNGGSTAIAPQDLPPWLSATSSEPTTASGSPSAGDMGLPSWLRGVADEPPPARTPARTPQTEDVTTQPQRRAAAHEDGEGDDFFKGAELPGWLRPPEVEQPTGSPEGQALDWLTRLGAADENDSEVSISSVRPIATSATPARRLYQRSSEQMSAVALLGQLVRAPYPAPVIAPAPVPLSRWQRVGLDRVLYILFAIVLVAGLLSPQIIVQLQTAAPTAPGVADLSQRLASLGPDDIVMIAYEWDAQRSAELRPLEQAVTSQVMKNKTKMIVLSTDLQGTLLSFDLRAQLRATGYNIDPDGRVFGGRDYVFLGYRPGGELALRLLAQNLRAELRSDFEGRDATQGLLATNLDGSPRVSRISDLSMIIVLADQPQDAQIWMEQVHSAAPSVPITFLIPQESEPMLQPYLRLPNVYHLAGLQGALAMSALTTGADSTAIARATGQQSLAVLTFVILLIGGGLGLALAHARKSRRGAA
ncbi:MAG: hypothetical protein WCK70_07330 [Chloroflexales bacterium]